MPLNQQPSTNGAGPGQQQVLSPAWNEQPTIMMSTWLGVCTILFSLRLYTRCYVTKWLSFDDAFLALAMICTYGIHACGIIGYYYYGWGRHLSQSDKSWFIPSLKLSYAYEVLFFSSGAAVSASILILYYRLTRDTDIRWFRAVLHVSTIAVAIIWTVSILLVIFKCYPLSALFDLSRIKDRCFDPKKVEFTVGGLKLFVDLYITTLPIPLIVRMRISKLKRLWICLLLGLGYTVTFAGALRQYSAWLVIFQEKDVTWYQYAAYFASTFENDVAIICVCIPATRPLVRIWYQWSMRAAMKVGLKKYDKTAAVWSEQSFAQSDTIEMAKKQQFHEEVDDLGSLSPKVSPLAVKY